MGRAPFDSKFCAARHPLFESYAPIERSLAPVYRHLVRGRAAVLQGGAAAGQESVGSMGFETASPHAQLGVTSAGFGDPLRSYVEDMTQSVVLAIAIRP